MSVSRVPHYQIFMFFFMEIFQTGNTEGVYTYRKGWKRSDKPRNKSVTRKDPWK